MRIEQLMESGAVRLDCGRAEVQVLGIGDDSRRIRPGDLFVARPGAVSDGRRFIADAIVRGAAAVLTDRPVEAPNGTAVLLTEDVAAEGLKIARRLHGDPASKLAFIGVTGTNGKTTTTWMVRHLLRASGRSCGLVGTVEMDNGRDIRSVELTTPGAIELMGMFAEMVGNGCGACVMEVSSHALHQGRVEGLDFRVAAFTNLSGDHLDYHGTMDAYADAKARLFETLSPDGWAVVNGDDPVSARMLRDCRARAMRFGEGHGDCRVTVHEATSQATDCTFDGPWGALCVRLPLIGRHNAMNMAAALCCVHAMGVDVMELSEAIERCPQTPGRLERVTIAALPFEVFVDYAHTDDALANALRALRGVTAGRLRVLFGCGGDRDATKRPRMAAVACELADDVVVTSDNPRTEDPLRIIEQVLAGAPRNRRDELIVEADRAAAIGRIIHSAEAGDVVLLAGKGHEDYQVIGTQKRPFDDRLAARAAMERRGQKSEDRNQG